MTTPAPGRPPLPYDHLPPVPAFRVSSADLDDGAPLGPAQLFNGFGLTGGNTSPQLRWSDFPQETAGFAVTCFDPDAPTGCGFWHWLLVDLPPTTTQLPAGAGDVAGTGLAPGAFHLRNDFGSASYDGPAARPGQGSHRYVFTVHALSCPSLGVKPDTSAAMTAARLTHFTIARATTVPVHQP